MGGADYETQQFNLATQSVRARPAPRSRRLPLSPPSARHEPQHHAQLRPHDDHHAHLDGQQLRQASTTARAPSCSATAGLSNTAYAQVAEAIGANAIIDTAHTMGLDATLQPYLTIALGAVAVSPLQMCEAYSTLPADGVHHDAVAITKIESRTGQVVYEHQDSNEQALERSVAEATIDVLMGVVTSGNTGYYVATTANQPVAGVLTGTRRRREPLVLRLHLSSPPSSGAATPTPTSACTTRAPSPPRRTPSSPSGATT